MVKTITERQPDGGVIYKAGRQLDLPDVDLLTLLLDPKYTLARPDTVLQADAADPTRCFTTSQTCDLMSQLAYAFRHIYGIGRNGPDTDSVFVVTTGDYRLQSLFFGTIAAGGIYSAGSPSSTPSELAYLAGLVEPKVIICNDDTRAVVEETAKEINFPADRVLCLGGGPGLDLTVVGTGKKLDLSPSRTLTWTRITDPKQLDDSIICVLFSSGTTGLPKGVRISHRMMVAECYLNLGPDKAYFARERPDFVYRTLAHVPAAHMGGVQSYFANSVYFGGTTYWMDKFDFAKFLAYQKRYKITFFFTVPPIWMAIAKHPAVTDQFDSQVWGLTETCGAITAMPACVGEYTGSVSHLVANHEARIVDENGKDAEPGEPGEIWVRGPVVTKGYWKNDKANGESFVDGWFCTGDIGRFSDGLLYVVDRKKELIKYKGLQVAPAELEELLLLHPKIADTAVIGVEGEGTEVPRAYVVPATKDLTEEEVSRWVEEKAAPYKKLRGGVVFVDAIPKSPSGKILRKVLREQAKKSDQPSRL